MPDSKNFRHICKPSNVVHVSNIAQSVGQQELLSLFGQYGIVKGFQYFLNNKRMALIEMSTLEESVIALIHTHNAKLGDLNLRVSFTNSNVNHNQL